MIKTMKQWLEALEKLEKHNRGLKITTVKTGEVIHPAQIAQEAITSLKQAIAEAEKQETAADDFYRMIADRNLKPFDPPTQGEKHDLTSPN